jgi:hypothetical protein
MLLLGNCFTYAVARFIITGFTPQDVTTGINQGCYYGYNYSIKPVLIFLMCIFHFSKCPWSIFFPCNTWRVSIDTY